MPAICGNPSCNIYNPWVMGVAWELIQATINKWFEDKAERLGAALAYYAAFSLAPLLIIVVAVVDVLYGGKSTDYIRSQMAALVGSNAAETIVAAISAANRSGRGTTATVISIVTLVIGATAVFAELQDALNTIWKVAPKPRQFLIETIRQRVLSFAMVLGICSLLLVSLILSAVLSGLSAYSRGFLPQSDFLWRIGNDLISFSVTSLLFALIYKILPDVEIAWSDVWIGAIATALLFTIGKELIGLYMGTAAIGSAYGAAGSILVVLAWVYYSAQILFIGAEFTHVYANRFGSQVRPARGGISLTERDRIRQGAPHTQTLENEERGVNAPTKPPSSS
jgi:membrane protein